MNDHHTHTLDFTTSTMDDLQSRVAKLEQIHLENLRRTSRLEEAIDLWRTQFQNLDNALVRLDGKIEHIQRDVGAFSENSPKLVQLEERLTVVQKDLLKITQENTQKSLLIYGAIATSVVAMLVGLALVGIRTESTPHAPTHQK